MNLSFFASISISSSSDSFDKYVAIYGFLQSMSIFIIGLSLLTIISMWKIYTKANKPGWAVLVPVYNIYVLLEIAELPVWYLLLLMIPIANIYVIFKTYIELAHKFGKSTGFGIGLIFLNFVFMPILAFGSATYNGNNNMGYQNNMNGMNNSMNNNMNNNMNSYMNGQPAAPIQPMQQTSVQNTFVEQNSQMQSGPTVTNTSFELPDATPSPEIKNEPVVENKFVQPNIEVPNADPVTDNTTNNNVQ